MILYKYHQKLAHFDFDEEDDCYLLTISIGKAGMNPLPRVAKRIPPVVQAVQKLVSFIMKY